MKVRLVTVVWGREFIGAFSRIAIRSLLAQGNVPNLSRAHQVTYTIFTTPEDANYLKADPAFIRLSSAVNVQLSLFSLGEIDGANRSSHAILWHRGIELARRNQEILFFIMPDVLYGRETLMRWIRRFEDGFKAVFSLGPQVVLETALPEIEARFPDPASPCEVDREQLYDLMARHFHPVHAMMRRDCDHRHVHQEYDLRIVRGQGLVIRQIVNHPFCVDMAFFSTLRHYGPVDHLETFAFEPCSILSIEPLIKFPEHWYRPDPLNQIRLSNLGGWFECHGTPGCERESQEAFEIPFRPCVDDRSKTERQRAVAGGAFFRAQIVASGRLFGLHAALQDRGFFRASALLATAVYAIRLRRRMAIRREAILFVPTDAALNEAWPHILDLLAPGREGDFIDFISDHVLLPKAETEVSRRWLGAWKADASITAQGRPAPPLLNTAKLVGEPFTVGPFTIHPINRVLWRNAPAGALTGIAATPVASSIGGRALFRVPPRVILRRFYRCLPQPLKIVAGYALVQARRLVGGLRRTAVTASTLFAVPREDVDTLRDIQRVRALRVVESVLADFVAELCIPGLQSEPHQLVRHILMQASAGSDIEEFVETRLVELTKRSPSWTAGWLELGFLRHDQGRRQDALACFQRAMQGKGADHRQLAIAAAHHGRLLAASGALEQACESFAAGLQSDSNQTLMAIDYADVLRRLGQPEQSLQCYAQAMGFEVLPVDMARFPRYAEHLSFPHLTTHTQATETTASRTPADPSSAQRADDAAR
jgi:hypothetical protein